ncbi:YeiH family protein [Schaalia vaccimaxillae]|uniref:YeiH family protein n=1 Tax=Schaalia vaccimaxillae TaxID=183916 RepID=UPI0003B3DCCE|nr:putative sulfate exporter family transporter [Schaalia vaccimaxillae]
MRKELTSYLPGVLISLVVALVAVAINQRFAVLSSMVVAIVIGVLLRNTNLLPAQADAGLKFTAKKILRLGVVLLGLRLSIPAVLLLGWQAIMVIVVTVVSVFAATIALGRIMRISRATTILTATGTAICGAAAVAGMSAVIRPENKSDDVEDAATTAIASVTIFGTLEIFLLPLLIQALCLPTTPAGVWTGAAVHEVGQVVATAGSISQQILDVAVVAKLGRVVLLAPLVALMGVVESRRIDRNRQTFANTTVLITDPSDLQTPQQTRSKTPIIPLFVLGFLVMVLVRALTDTMVDPAVFDHFNTAATFLLTMAMFAMGSDVRLGRILKTGLGALSLGLAAGLVSLLVSLAGVLLLLA